jgi:putative flippase GtrA
VVRFLGVGGLNALATYGLFLTFLWTFGIYYVFANLLAFIAWSWFGYELQRRFVFSAVGAPFVFARYIANQLFFMVAGTGILALLVDVATIPPPIAYLIMLAIVTTGLFLTSKFLVFSKPSAT